MAYFSSLSVLSATCYHFPVTHLIRTPSPLQYIGLVAAALLFLTLLVDSLKAESDCSCIPTSFWRDCFIVYQHPTVTAFIASLF